MGRSAIGTCLGVALILGLASCGDEEAGEVVNPLPKLSDIRAMKAEYNEFKPGGLRRFEVPREHWQPILDALQPARRTEEAKWDDLGALEIIEADGQPFRVGLWAIPRGPAPFSAGKPFEEGGYYRGGTTEALIRALDAAYEASQKAEGSVRSSEGRSATP